MKQTKKIVVACTIGLIVSVGILILLNRLPSQSTNQENSIQNSNSPQTEEEAAQSEKVVIDTTTTQLKEALAQKNGWNSTNYTLLLTYFDGKFVVAHIQSTNTAVPSGDVLAQVDKGKYHIIFDSATVEPCALLEENVLYPQVVTDMCNASNN